jgi:hypothetical protein
MKRMGCALLLAAGTVVAQSKPLQLFPPRSTQDSVAKQALDAAKQTLNFTPAPTRKVINCAIPLWNIPIPAGWNFMIRRATPSSSIDSKMVVKPPLPACAAKP